MNRHPLSALFAQYDLAGEDLNTLAEDIKANGLHLPITTHEGMILDGWNRFQACQIAKARPIYISLAPGLDPWEFVKGANMLRRHMTPAERVAVMLLKLRMEGEHSRMGECPNNQRVPNGTPPPSIEQIEKDLDVGRGTAQRAAQVARANDPALVDALTEKRVSLDRAAELAKMPAPERKAALEAPVTPLRPTKADPGEDPAVLKERIKGLEAKVEDLEGKLSEAGCQVQELHEENESLHRILDAEDLLGTFKKEVLSAQERARVAESQRNGVMVENRDLAERLKSAMRKIDRLQKKPPEEAAS